MTKYMHNAKIRDVHEISYLTLEEEIMKRFKKIVTIACAAALVFSMTACSGGSGGKTPADKDAIIVGRVAPLSGPLASFGKGSLEMEKAAVEKLNADGGIYIEEYDKKLPIEFVLADSESSTTKASEAATKLINESNIDIMIVSHTVDTVNPVTAACERAGIPCISVDAPADAWLSGGPYTSSYHAFFDTETEISCFIDAWDLADTNKKVGILAANDNEGIEVSGNVAEYAEARGYEVYDPGRFTSGSSDYTSIINDLKKADCDIIVGVMITPDFATFWQQCHSQGYVPKVSTIAKACLFRADVAAIGENGLASGVVSEVWWTPNHPYKSSLTGQTSAEIGQIWTDLFNEPAAPTAGYKYANVEILVDILTRAASLEPEKVLAAAAETNLDTVVGHVEYDENHVSVMNLVTGQWVYHEDGTWTQEIVANKQIPDCSVSADMIYIPGATQ